MSLREGGGHEILVEWGVFFSSFLSFFEYCTYLIRTSESCEQHD